MKVNIAKEVEKLNRRRKFRNIWHNIVRVLACVVVFVTTYALILPAITMENNPNCGYEQHEHDESCYTEKILNCEKTEDIHEHSEECYDEIEVISKILICEEEHEHEETCYENELECEKTEDIHEHTEECYEIIYVDVETPICEKEETEEHKHDETCITKEINCEEEHEHEDSCYVKNITCGKEETQGHTHDENCYKKQEEKLICEKEEVTPHVHNEDCYKKVLENKLTCETQEITPHEHIEECYEIITSEEITCNKTQHIHNESCYESIDLVVSHVIELIENLPTEEEIINKLNEFEENEDYDGEIEYSMQLQEDVIKAYSAYSKLTEEQKAKVTNADKILDFEYIWSQAVLAPIPLDQYIVSVDMKHKKPDTNKWEDVVNGEVQMGDDLRFVLHFKIPGKVLSTVNNTVEYKPNITITKKDEGSVLNGEEEVGTYIISTDGTITIIFNDDYASKNANGYDITGHIAFQSSVDKIQSNTQGDANVNINGQINLEINITDKVSTTNDLLVNKTSSNLDASNGTIDYKIEVTSQNGTGSEVVLTDEMVEVELQNINNITVKDKSGRTVNFEKYKTDNGFILTLPEMGGNSKYTITYTADVKDINTLNGNKTLKNNVGVTSTDNDGGKLEDYDNTTDVLTRDILSKSGVKNGENIDWTIIINKSQVDIGGWTLSDKINEQPLSAQVTISPNPEGNGTLTKKLPYTFPSGSNKTYTVTYSTPATSSNGSSIISNIAELIAPNGDKVSVGIGINSRDNENGIDKTAVGVTLTDNKENGNILATYKWKIVFNATEQAMVPYEQTVDNKIENAWVYRDELLNENIQWITGAQLKELKANLDNALKGKYDSTFKIIAYRWDGTNYNKYRDPVTVDDNLSNENKYSQFAILFYGTLEKGNYIEVEYSSTVNIGDGSMNVSVTNYGYLNEKESEKKPTQSYNLTISKVDAANPNGGSITYRDISDTWTNWETNDVKGILAWDIYVTFPDIEYDIKDLDNYVYIYETLPEGVTLLRDAISTNQLNYTWDITFECGPSDVVAGNGHFDFNESNPAHFHYRYIPPGQTQEDWIPIYAYKSETGNELTFKVDPRIADALRGVTSRMTILVKIDNDYNWQGTTGTFKNTVRLEYNDENLGQASQTQVIEKPLLLKDIKKESDNIISYILTLNDSRQDLLPDSDTLIIEDELKFDKPASGSVNANLMLNTVKVYKVAVNGIKTDITNYCVITTSETDANNQIIKKFELVVPDSEKIVVEYNYRITGSEGTDVSVFNTASIKGYQSTENKDDVRFQLNIQESVAGATLVGVKLVKVDLDNYLITLDGAKFKLEKFVGDELILVNTFTTENGGQISTGELEEDVVYQFVEIDSPYGYEIDPTPYKFMIAGPNSDVKPENFDGKILNNGDSITITNKKVAAYELPETGGIGTHIYTRSGIALILTTIIASLILKKKKGGDDN